jgi:hypothetical protein
MLTNIAAQTSGAAINQFTLLSSLVARFTHKGVRLLGYLWGFETRASAVFLIHSLAHKIALVLPRFHLPVNQLFRFRFAGEPVVSFQGLHRYLIGHFQAKCVVRCVLLFGLCLHWLIAVPDLTGIATSVIRRARQFFFGFIRRPAGKCNSPEQSKRLPIGGADHKIRIHPVRGALGDHNEGTVGFRLPDWRAQSCDTQFLTSETLCLSSPLKDAPFTSRILYSLYP